jgi:hypothetical protein
VGLPAVTPQLEVVKFPGRERNPHGVQHGK